jgi:membrane protein DedA with SNARE-associated domain
MASAFQAFVEHYAAWGYSLLFAGVLLENAGLPVPGETAVLAAGFLSSDAGGGQFRLAWVIPLTIVSAVIGDNISFWLGRRFARPRLQSGRKFLFLNQRTLAWADQFFDKYGAWAIFFQRFVTGLRVIGALAAGTSAMRWSRFLLANAAGATVWAVAMSLLGYFFGQSWELVHRWLGWGGVVLLVVAVGVVAALVMRRGKYKLPR